MHCSLHCICCLLKQFIQLIHINLHTCKHTIAFLNISYFSSVFFLLFHKILVIFQRAPWASAELQDEKWCTCVLSKDRLAVEGQGADSRGPIRLNRRLQLTPYKEVQLIRTLSVGRQQWGPDAQTLTPGGLESKGRDGRPAGL